ncbi:uncharacterized protein Z518_07187 [Rhinocladiella mackenziei CBS 650.93]|uniref:Heterokaryon incompatibility domain-containing protein n=1 Tax=Rhinocladiella mackenziei CBS 650.93 TaxID=1442369 RepID=A0A0D2ICP9_9EURO|nr:uncharacterized protein Z518_07187 [Rhinocladiella mackenziei CBS 650.93]KIX03634.1 hypothetical protein Z518_07187 [Rhinocladiella mackenziei CBS 650.93]
MEGVLPSQPWLSPMSCVKVPCLSPSTHQPGKVPFYDFPRHSGLVSADDVASLARNFPTISSLASFMQSWLFFELLSAFLGQPVSRSDLVTDGFINLDQEAVHGHFWRWKKMLWRASNAQRREAQHAAQDMIHYALLKGDLFEEAADSFGRRDDGFDRVALSVKLLACLLIAVLDDTYVKSSGVLTRWIHTAFGRATFGMVKVANVLDPLHRGLNNPKLSFVDDYFSEMSLSNATKDVYGYEARFVPLHPSEPDSGRAASLLIRLLERNGWCPYRARQVCQSYDYMTVNNLAGLIRNRSSVEDHGRCLETRRCTAHDVEIKPTSTYPFRHECDGNCEFVRVPYEEIANIVRSGGIPVISCSIEGPLDVKIVRCTAQTAYTAISHVWSDGLGNPNENALPLCQLLWLREKIRQTYIEKYPSPLNEDGPMTTRWTIIHRWEISHVLRPDWLETPFGANRIFFWMDTLCIPVSLGSQKSVDNRELRFRAIKQIAPIFSGAINTLILDRGLQDTTSLVPHRAYQVCGDELATLILGSKWMERGWTLEEGCLARSCVLQLMGMPYYLTPSLANRIPKIERHHSPLARVFVQSRRSMVMLLKTALLEDRKRIPFDVGLCRASRLAEALLLPQFVWAWNSLVNRSTTKPQDGVLILANLLDLNVYPLRLLSGEERLMAVIQSCNELPLSLMYNTGRRVHIEGHPELGWIPKDISGNCLTVGAAIRKLKTRKTNDRVAFSVERSERYRQSVLIVATKLGQCIPRSAEIFRVQIPMGNDSGTETQEYIIEIQDTTPSPQIQESHNTGREANTDFLGTCMVIDLTYGTQRARGFAARGVRFLVHARSRMHMDLSYDAPLIARTPKQWWYHRRELWSPLSLFVMESVPLRKRLIIKYGKKFSSHSHSPNTPVYNHRPLEAGSIAC